MRKRLLRFSILTAAAIIGAYYVGAVLVGAAVNSPNSLLRYEEIVTWQKLVGQLRGVSWANVPSVFLWFLTPVFALLLGATLAFTFEKFKLAARAGLVATALSLGALPALLGAVSLPFTLLYASGGELDREWLDEYHAVFEAFFLAFSLLCASLFVRAVQQVRPSRAVV